MFSNVYTQARIELILAPPGIADQVTVFELNQILFITNRMIKKKSDLAMCVVCASVCRACMCVCVMCACACTRVCVREAA